MPWWGWIALGLVGVTVEIFLSTDFVLVFFGVSAILLGLVGVLGPSLPAWAQVLLFCALAVPALMVYRSRFRGNLRKADSIVEAAFAGETAVVTETIESGATGRAEMGGTLWEAHNRGAERLHPGDPVIVENVRDLVLFVRSESTTSGDHAEPPGPDAGPVRPGKPRAQFNS